MDHTTGAVLGQTDVEATTNEIARFRSLLEGWTWPGGSSPPTRSTQREHAA
jgi:hypothetical protein